MGSWYISIWVVSGKVSIWEGNYEHEQLNDTIQWCKISLRVENIFSCKRFYKMFVEYWPNLENGHLRSSLA